MRLPGVGALSAKWPWMRYALRDLVQDDNTARLNMAYVVSNPPATFTPRTSTPVSANQRTPRAGVWPARRSWKSAAVRACRAKARSKRYTEPSRDHLAGIDVSHRAIGAPSTPWKVGVRPHCAASRRPAGALPRRTNPPLLSRRQQSWAATWRRAVTQAGERGSLALARLPPPHAPPMRRRWRRPKGRRHPQRRPRLDRPDDPATPQVRAAHLPCNSGEPPRLLVADTANREARITPPTRSQPCGPRRLAERRQRSRLGGVWLICQVATSACRVGRGVPGLPAAPRLFRRLFGSSRYYERSRTAGRTFSRSDAQSRAGRTGLFTHRREPKPWEPRRLPCHAVVARSGGRTGTLQAVSDRRAGRGDFGCAI